MAASRTMVDEIPIEGTHSSLQFFDPSHILVNYTRGYDEEVFPQTSPDGPVLEFEFSGAKSQMNGSVIDTSTIELELVVKISTDEEEENDVERPTYVNNLMHSLFSNCELYLQGVQVSTTNNLYAHKTLIETELSHPTECKKTILRCQGYAFEDDPGDTRDGEAFESRRASVKDRQPIHLYGNIAIDFFGTDKFLLPDVEARIRLIRSANSFVLIRNPESEVNYTVKIIKASIHIHKLELKTDSFLSIERALTKKPARYPFTEVISKSFIIPQGSSQFRKDDVFTKEPVSRIVLAMNKEIDFTGLSITNPYHYRKFNLQRITIEREGLAVGGTPLDTLSSDVRSYYNTLKSLGIEHCGNGIRLEDIDNHYILAFRLTADTKTNDDSLRPELTGGRLSVVLEFSKPLGYPLRVFFYGERRSNIYISGKRDVLKNSKFYYG